MSTQIVVAAAAAVVGYFVGGPTGAQVGWALGMAIAAPTTEIEGARLEDLRVTGTEYGAPIPYVIGHPRLAGQIIYSSEKREVSHTESGKGGGTETTTYSYEIDCLYLLADNETDGIVRIWSNGELIYTVKSDATADSIKGSLDSDAWRRITFYDGNENQLPDPTYEAAIEELYGPGLAPAYRGKTTVFIEGLNLGSGGALPNLTFEIAENQTATGIRQTYLNTSTGVDYQDFGQPAIISVEDYVRVTGLDPRAVFNHRKSDGERAGTAVKGDFDGFPGPNLYYSHPVGIIGNRPLRFQNRNQPLGSAIVLPVGWLDDQPDEIEAYDLSNPLPGSEYIGGIALSTDGEHALILTGPTYTGGSFPCDKWYLVRYTSTSLSAVLVTSGTVSPTIGLAGFGAGSTSKSLTRQANSMEADLRHIWVVGSSTQNASVYKIDDTGNLALYDTLTAAIPIASGEELAIYATGGVCYAMWRNNFAVLTRLAADPGDTTVSDVVRRLCYRAGMTSEMIDTSDLDDIEKPVRALAVSQVAPTRSVLNSLGTAFYFDTYLDDVLHFVKRGGDVAATIDLPSLGASGEEGGDKEVHPFHYANELELPATVSLSYLNVDNDFLVATESSDRLNTGQSSAQTISLALGLTGDEAKGIVDSVVRDSVASLKTVNVKVPLTFTAVTPTDIVQVVDNQSVTHRMRVGRRTEADGVIGLELVGDDADALIDEGDAGDYGDGTTDIPSKPGTEIYPMDIPILRDADNTAGWYVAGKGTDVGWHGGVVMRSTTSAESGFSETVSLTNEATAGFAETALPDFDGGSVFDTKSTVTVDVGLGSLYSATRDELLLDGSLNAILIGSEIVRFSNASNVSGGIYILSDLLRGQRGTEWAIGSHETYERVVLLKEATLRRYADSVADINRNTWLMGVTFGRDISTGFSQPFVDTGVSMKPFSPYDLRAGRDIGTGVLILSWKRRSRFSTNLSTCPLGETSEAYEVDILDGGTVVRTLTTNSPSVGYQPSDQIDDLGEEPASISFNVYQIGSIGRGYVASASINIGLLGTGGPGTGDGGDAFETPLLMNFTSGLTDEAGIHSPYSTGNVVVSGGQVATTSDNVGFVRINQVGTSLDFGSTDFTIEMFCTPSNGSGAKKVQQHLWMGENYYFADGLSQVSISSQPLGESTTRYDISARLAFNDGTEGSSVIFDLTSSGEFFAVGPERHIAVQRKGRSIQLFVDGDLIDQKTISSGLNTFGHKPYQSQAYNLLGVKTTYSADAMAEYPYFGSMNAIRVVKRKAIYSDGYTVPTLPLPIYS